MVGVGDVAPTFELKGTTTDGLNLADIRGQKRAVLVFYPKDRTSGCTNQLNAIRDAIDDFRAADTEPYGVNHGDAASHQAFIDAYDFPFDLLIDEGLQVSNVYGAAKPDGSGINRTVVVVGKNGKVIFRQAGAPTPTEVLAAIREADDES
jgi:peroxiredoxin Q/BCP